MDVRTYTNPVFYPRRDNFSVVYAYAAGECLFKGTKEEYRGWAEKNKSVSHSRAVEIDEESFQEQKRLWNKAEKERLDKFKVDALAHVGLLNHPKADKVYAYAYQQNDGSLESIVNMLDDLAELILD